MSAGADFDVEGAAGVTLRGEREGDGPPVVLLHGITAHRDLVVHGSRALPRAGFEVARYDARAHGQSDGGPAGSHTYEVLADDLEEVVASGSGSALPVLAGSSMGAHTIVTMALRDPERVAGLVIIGPASSGLPPPEESLAHWDALAAGLEGDGVEGFLAAYDDGLDPDWRETLMRIARERLETHRNLDALALALREVPRSVPFDGLTELEALDVPALVVASGDEADPGHPRSVAEAYASSLPEARLIGEEAGESPLAWQGGKLSREIADFCAEPGVRERVEAG